LNLSWVLRCLKEPNLVWNQPHGQFQLKGAASK
jgi:hypothetical protein